MDKNPIMEESTTCTISESTAEPKLEGEVAKLKGQVLRDFWGQIFGLLQGGRLEGYSGTLGLTLSGIGDDWKDSQGQWG